MKVGDKVRITNKYPVSDYEGWPAAPSQWDIDLRGETGILDEILSNDEPYPYVVSNGPAEGIYVADELEVVEEA